MWIAQEKLIDSVCYEYMQVPAGGKYTKHGIFRRPLLVPLLLVTHSLVEEPAESNVSYLSPHNRTEMTRKITKTGTARESKTDHNLATV